jgi:hypothetical protein
VKPEVRRRVSWRVLLVGAGFLTLLRQVSLGWGASAEEVDATLPGDELLSHVNLCATRAVTIRAAPGEVWPWIAQLGQGRGGFYSYDFVENLVGCDIHSADSIVRQWQGIAVGDQVNLAPTVALTVARVDPGRALVLRGGIPATVARSSPYDFTWAFVLCPASGGTTRLVVRERYAYAHRWVAAVVEPVELVSFIMSRRMMHGIRQRSDRHSP